MRRTWVAIALLSACAEEPKIADRHSLGLSLEGGGWTEFETQAALNASSTWNLEFGTRLRLSEFGDENVVPIAFSEDACVNSRNQATHARATSDPPSISICPATAESQVLLFETIRHELGHILGIPVHATDGYAVMTGRATNLVHWFRDEDRDLFFGANPGFAGETGCAVSPRIADGTPMLGQYAGDLHLIWAKADLIRFAPMSHTGVIGAEGGRLSIDIEATSLDAHSTDSGYLVTWFEENRFNLSTVALPEGDFSQPQVVQLDPSASSFYRVSEQHVAPYYWLGLTVREGETNTARTLHLFQFDERDGSTISSVALPAAHGQLVARDGQLYLITVELDLVAGINRVRMHRIAARADGFDLIDSIDIASIQTTLTDLWALPEPILTAESTSAGIVMLLQSSAESIDLVRVTTDGALAVEKSFTVHVGKLSDPTILEAAGHVFIGGVMPNSSHYEDELYVLRLAPDSLDVEEPWLLLSAADSVSASEPRLAVYGESLIAVWRDSSGDVRSRCVRL